MSYQNYVSNLDVIDKYGFKNINVDPSFIYKGDTNNINKQIPVCITPPPPLAAAVLGLDNTGAPLSNLDRFHDGWTDIDAQELYLNSKPTCYLIIGKSGVGSYILGETLSKKLNCVHLCPKNIIQDEIKQKSPTGNCLEFNMTHNQISNFETIFTILKTKLNSPAVQHRGYVLSGLPLVSSSKSSHYLINTLVSEEALLIMDELLLDVLCNLKKKKPKAPKEGATTQQTSVSSLLPEEEQHEEEEEEEPEPEEGGEEEEPPVELPKFILDNCSDLIFNKKAHIRTLKSILLEQIKDIFDLCLKPDIIINITCPDTDLVILKNHKYIDYKSSHHTFDPFVPELSTELRWPSPYDTKNYQNPHDIHNFNPKYNCKPPMNFTERSTNQMCNYKSNVSAYLKNKMKDFNPKFIIKLDGRTTVHQMMHHVTERLVLMHIHHVLIPEPLYIEEPPEELDEFWSTVEEMKTITSGISFKLTISPWFNRCPVELKNRRSVRGNPKFAVMFFKHVYLLSSLKAMISFCRNPRPFLKLQYLEPTCRIIVIGTKSTGKTMVSECLSWLFDAPVINYSTFYKHEKQKKYDSFTKSILSEIIATIEDSRFIKWQRKELDRVSYINAWCDSTAEKLKKYVKLSNRISSDKPVINQAVSDEQEIIKQEISDKDRELQKQLTSLKNQLSFLPFIDDIKECKNIMAKKKMLSDFAPLELLTITEKPKIPVLGDEDVTEAVSAYVVANDLQKEFEPTVDELMNELTKDIMNIDDKTQKDTNLEQHYGKYIIDGFPSNPEYWSYLSEAKLMPDYTIALIENRELEPEMLQYYAEIDKCLKNHQERFLLANDPFIKTRLRTNKPFESTILNVQIIIQDTLNSVINSVSKLNTRPEEIATPQLLVSFTESIEKFREDWDSIKLKLEEDFKYYIEVELEKKSDIEVIEEVLLKIRKCYYLIAQVNEDEERDDQDDDEDKPKDLLSFNSSQFLCDTNIYCPIAYYDHGILWEGKPEYSVKYDGRFHYFCKEEFIELFQNDITRYQSYNKPFKQLPSLKICVIGCIGSGKTALSKNIAKELGLIYIDFVKIINEYMLPRHYKKVGRQYENTFKDEPIDEEGIVDFQMDEENENMLSDILSNETEMRRMIHGYFERGSPILSLLMQKLIKKLWFELPFIKTGFVLDGFPRLPSDVEDMIASFCIPDTVLELQGSSESSLNRVAPIMFQTWKSQLNEAKLEARLKLDNEIKNWMQFITKNVISKLLCNDIFDSVFSTNFETLGGPSTESVIIDSHPSGSVKVDPNLFNIYNEMIQEYPEPKGSSEWEKPDDVRERIDSRIESIYETDDENIQGLMDILSEQRIRTVTVDATKPLNKVIRIVLLKLEKLRRCESFFEQTFIVPYNIAETLLTEGFCFISKFDRLCPVYIKENPYVTLNLYKTNKHHESVFPVVHRSYVYFINGKDGVIKFRRNPLKYITCNTIKSFVEFPLKIAVIGAPKSGKSSLSAKLAKRNGLLCISRGKALRHVLDNMSWTELALRILKSLRDGIYVESDLIMSAIQTIAIDPRTVTNGFVLDGFPNSPPEAMELVKLVRRVPVPDERYDYLCEYHKPASKVPAFLNVVDIAGLVRGAAEGQGLGNAFLSHIKACDAIFNLCRAFDDEDVIHVDGEVNPVRDLETIGEELRLKDEEQLMQNIEKLDRVVNRGNDKKLKPEYDTLSKIKTVVVDEKRHIRFGDWSVADIEILNKYLFLTSKPALYLVNLSEKDYIRKKNKWLPKLKEWIDKNDPGAPLIPFSGVFETKLLDMEPAERQAYLKEHNLTSALDKIIVQGYKALQLEYFFTAGVDEVKAWTIQKGTKAPQAAGRIHTDFEKGFIMAEVMHFKDFKEEGTEAACKAAGKYRQQGRNYVVEDGDIIFFKFNAGAGLKDAKKK